VKSGILVVLQKQESPAIADNTARCFRP